MNCRFVTFHPETTLVMTYRDPKGASLSQFHFYKKHPTLGVSPTSPSTSSSASFSRATSISAITPAHVKGYFDSGRHGIAPDQSASCSHEDLVEHKVEVIRQLEQALFGGTVFTDAQRNASPPPPNSTR